MKVAVLDLGSFFAKIFKASVQPPVVGSPVAPASSGSASAVAATGPAGSSVGNAGSTASTGLNAAQTVTLFPMVAPKSPVAPRVPSVPLPAPATLHPLLTASYPRVSSVREVAEIAGAPFSLPSSPRAARLQPLSQPQPLPHPLTQSQPLLSSQSQLSSQSHSQLQPLSQSPSQTHLQFLSRAQQPQSQPRPQLPSQTHLQAPPQPQYQFQPLSQPPSLLSQSLPLPLPQPHLQLLPHPQPQLQPLPQLQPQFLPQLQPQPLPLPLLHSPVQPLARRGSGGGGTCSNSSGANSPALPLPVTLWRPGGVGVVLKPITGTGSSSSSLAASPARSPRQPGPGEREPGAWIVPGQSPKTLFITLPDIGEEWGTDTESEEDGSSETKGLTEGPGEQRLSVKSRDPLPKHFTKNVQEAIHHYNCECVSSLSSSGNTTPTDLNNFWSGTQSITTERSVSTEQSSVSSWTDDEFDKATTQKVQQLFREVDEMLFEGKISPHCQNLQAESEEWTRRSIHLRVLGTQLMFPTDEGVQHFPSNTASSVHIKSSLDLCESNNSLKELCISGSKLVPEDYTQISSVASDKTASFLEEEIYDVDGEIEEYFAFDKKELDDEPKKTVMGQQRNKHGIPPISPEDCIKDAAAAEVFDHAWRNVVEMLEELVRKMWETAPQGRTKQRENLKTAGNKLAKLPSSRIPPNPSSVPPSRGSETHSTSLGFHLGPSQSDRFSSNFSSDLNGVMTIQAKPLQQRHTHFADRTLYRLGQVSDHSVVSSSRVLPTSARKTPAHRKLPSLSSDLHQSKPSSVYSDKVLRGTKLQIGSDCLSSPSIQVPRNRLPPISSEAGEQNIASPGSRQAFHRGRYPQNRVLSAVPGNIERPPLRERTVISEQFSRPNTTHTFRSDTPHKRSLTPMEFVNHTWTGQGFLTGSQHLPKSYQSNTSSSRRRFPVVS